MAARNRGGAQGLVKAKNIARPVAKRWRHQYGTVVGEGYEAAVEGGVEVWSKEDAVKDIEAFRIGLAVSPGFDVACAKQLGHRQSGDGAAALPVVHQPVAENLLADSLNGKPLGLGGPWHTCRLVEKHLERFVGQSPRELEGPPHETVQCRQVTYPACCGRTPRERTGECVAQRGEGLEDVVAGKRHEEQRFAARVEPDLQGRMAAAKDEPIPFPPVLEVEAVVSRGLLEAGDAGRVEPHWYSSPKDYYRPASSDRGANFSQARASARTPPGGLSMCMCRVQRFQKRNHRRGET